MISYSQHGEDFLIVNLFNLMGIDKPSYLDLGAHHPSEISNTKMLYDAGSRGVNVEANPLLMEEFHRQRPEDKNINIGIGLTKGVFPFYRVDPKSGLNTFVPEELVRVGIEATSVVEVEVVTIAELLVCRLSGWPDFLNMDIEGLDFEILKDAEFTREVKFELPPIPGSSPIYMRGTLRGPKVICAEIRDYEQKKTKDLMLKKGYDLLCRFDANLIFLRQDGVKFVR